MSGRTIAVTGASAGIGEATALLCARAGDRVVMLSRDRARTEAAAARVRHQVPSAVLEVEPCDLGSFAAVREAAGRITERHPRLDVLAHVAGVVPGARTETTDGHEQILQVNYLSPVLLTSLLLPTLRRNERAARIVWVAGIYHRGGELDLDDLDFTRRTWALGPVNAQAQLARVATTVELARHLDRREVTINAVHPGAVRTHAQDHAPIWAKLLIATFARPVFVDPPEGAEPVVHLVGDPSLEGVTGRFFDRMHEAELVPRATDATIGRALLARASAMTGASWPWVI